MRAWRRRAAATSSPRAAPRAASACRPDPVGIGDLRDAHARLKVRAEFLAARKGRRLGGPFFFIEALDRRDAAPPRYGLTVTRKIGNAVVRNRVRRRLREAVRTVAGADMAAGFDYVIVARPDIIGAPFEAIGRELSRRFRKTASPAAASVCAPPSPASEL